MQRKPGVVVSIFQMTCPRCREGRMFPFRMYSRKFMQTSPACPCCGQSFVVEPGFYLGSAYFSYFLNGALLLSIALFLHYSDIKITILSMIISIVVVVFGLLPVTLRFSKSLWIHIFVRYEGPCREIRKLE